jgi:hypothetical protein
MAVTYLNRYKYFSSQGPPKYNQIGIFGMKLNILSGNPDMNRFKSDTQFRPGTDVMIFKYFRQKN